MKNLRMELCSSALGLIACAGSAAGQYTIEWSTIDGGGVSVASQGPYELGGTIAQPDAGVLAGGTYTLGGGFWAGGVNLVPAGVEDPLEPDSTPRVPTALALSPASPNPFGERTTLAFDLPRAERVRLGVFDASGARRRTLEDALLPPGRYQRAWDGRDEDGREVGAGIYFVRLQVGPRQLTRKLVRVQ